jgi:hypothetical protein
VRPSLYGVKAGGEEGDEERDEEEGIGMGRFSERVILECEECGERLVLRL